MAEKPRKEKKKKKVKPTTPQTGGKLNIEPKPHRQAVIDTSSSNTAEDTDEHTMTSNAWVKRQKIASGFGSTARAEEGAAAHRAPVGPSPQVPA